MKTLITLSTLEVSACDQEVVVSARYADAQWPIAYTVDDEGRCILDPEQCAGMLTDDRLSLSQREREQLQCLCESAAQDATA